MFADLTYSGSDSCHYFLPNLGLTGSLTAESQLLTSCSVGCERVYTPRRHAHIRMFFGTFNNEVNLETAKAYFDADPALEFIRADILLARMSSSTSVLHGDHLRRI